MEGSRLPGERIGEKLVRIGAMTEEQVKEVLRLQREKASFDRLFGEIAVELQFVDQETIEAILDQGAGGETGRSPGR
jgi:hypothetical protein